MCALAKGTARVNKVYGDKTNKILAPVLQSVQELAPDLMHYIMDFAQGEVYTREGISDKDRELAIVACFIGQGMTNEILQAHIVGMLNCGWTQKEVIELIISLAPNIGFPPVIAALKCAQIAFKAHSS